MCSLEWRGIQMGSVRCVGPFTQARPGVLAAQVLPSPVFPADRHAYAGI